MVPQESHGALPMKSLFVRPIQLLAVVFVLTLLSALGALALVTWLNFQRIDSVRSHVNRTFLLQDSQLALKQIELELASGSAAAEPERLAVVRHNLELIPVKGSPVGPWTQDRLRQLDGLLTQAQREPAAAVGAALDLVSQMLARENEVQGTLLDEVYDNISLEHHLALLALVGFPGLLLLILWALRERILRPIGNLKDFLSRLSEGDFAPVPLAPIDPLLRPLFDNYNRMVIRLEQLEQSTRSRTLSLEQEVQAATHALLKQQQSLARADRLAATGEVSAAVAHELRNPIAGIHVTLTNLRSELLDPALSERVDLVIAELQRITRLLNGLLQQSSHVPEPRRRVRVDRLVHDLANLIRYQLPPQIQLEVVVPEGLECRLPEDGVRQAVLNLVLNAMEAMQPLAGIIRLAVEVAGGVVKLRVEDEGPGFSEEMLAGGIRPFFSSRETGTGLGLAFVRRFARDLGGELSIANREPHGASVTMTLPCHDRHPTPDRG
jgi:signal transduction histidine kinase